MKFSYLALGDSYTIGEGLDVENSFPFLLADNLKAKYHQEIWPEIIAKTGWTTTDLKQHLAEYPPLKNQYSIASLLIGVNNQYQRKPFELFQQEFEQLCSFALSMVGNIAQRVIVLSIPDYSVTPYANELDSQLIAKELIGYNDYIKEVSGILGFQFVNITGTSQLAKENPHLLAEDLLHPSKEMYEIWVEKIIAETSIIDLLK